MMRFLRNASLGKVRTKGEITFPGLARGYRPVDPERIKK